MTFHDHFSGHAGAYTRFRPHYPPTWFEFLASLVPRHALAWDCGTGNGQAAVALAAHFEAVVATDASSNQIAHAEPHPSVTYRVAPAEACRLEPDSVDLVTVAQAVHWFDFERFYTEVRRVGREISVLAVWSYGLATIDPAVDRVVLRLYSDILGSYWPPERHLIEERYATIPFPFEEMPCPTSAMTAEWRLADLIGYLETWSSVQKYLERQHADPLELVKADLAAAWGAADRVRQVTWPLFARLGRIHAPRA